MDQLIFRQLPEKIQITQDERVLGDDADRMSIFQTDFQDLTGEPVVFLCRLVTIRIARQHDR